MESTKYKCSKSGGDHVSIKYGKTPDGRQRYKCKVCGKRFLKDYTCYSREPITKMVANNGFCLKINYL